MPSSASCTSAPTPGRPRRSRAANGATGCATGERRAEARGRRRSVRLSRRSESPRNARSSPGAAAAPIARALPYDARLAQLTLRSRSSMRLPSRLASRLARSFTPLAALVLAAACASKPVEEKAVSPKATSAAPSAAAKAATDPLAAGKSGAAAPALRKAAIGDFGFDLSAGNRNLKPGDDFFAYANGGWYDSFTIPPDHSSYGPFDQLDELSKKRVREIIEQAAAAHGAAATPEQQIGDFYAAFMDEAAIEANGLAPAEADLKRIAAANTHEAIARLFGEPGFASLFDVQLPADFKNPDRYAVIVSESTLGLPDRDYYLKDDAQLKELRAKYVAYIEQMLTLGGVNDAQALAHEIMAFETAASKVQWPTEKRRDVEAIYDQHRNEHQLVTRVVYRLVLAARTEEHTSELQSLRHLVCRLLVEKKEVRRCIVMR